MKKIFKFAAMAFAAVALIASCDNKEEYPGTPETPEDPVTYSIEGKQWLCTFDDVEGEIPCVIDLGATEEGRMLVGVYRDGNWEEDGMICNAAYTIEKTSETSGIITYISDYLLDLMGDEESATEKICYSDLTETSVKFSEHPDYPMPWLALVFDEAATVSEEKITIEVLPVAPETPETPETPATVSIDGKQWMTEMMGTGVFIDLGVKSAGMSYSGYCDPESYAVMQGRSLGEYTITVTDETSGTINIEGVDMVTGEPATLVYKYMDLTDASVKIDFNIIYGAPTMEGAEISYAEFVLVPVVMEYEDMYENM